MAKGNWFAEWNKDFNNYMVQTIIESIVDGKKHFEKQSLQSFLMNLNTHAPIRYCNGDTLDNRKSNIELYVPRNINNYEEFNESTFALILRDKYGNLNGKSLIDKEDLTRVLNIGYPWVAHKVKGEPFAIANTPEGRIFMNRFVMDTPEDMITHPINLNTLDNRKSNLKNILKNDDHEHDHAHTSPEVDETI